MLLLLHDNIFVPIIINYQVLYLILDAQRRLVTYKDLIKIFILLLCISNRQEKEIEIAII